MRLLDDLTAAGPNRTKRIVGVLGLLGFLASLAVHISTFLGPGLAATMKPSIVGPLHVGIFPLFLATMYSLRVEVKGMAPNEVKQHVLALLPRWAKVLFVVGFYYAAVNFGLFMLGTGGASAERHGDGYVLTSHGRVVRHVTREEALENEARTARGFSGHWMVFYLFPTLFFLARKQSGGYGEGAPSLVR